MRPPRFALISSLALAGLSLACQPPADFERLGGLTADDLPPSPTNAWADDPEAAVLGQALFFDTRMSADGEVGCVTCHDPDHAFADPEQFSMGSFARLGGRHAPSLMNVAFNEFTLWDGRSDSLWSQPIKAIEAEPEGDFTRTELAHFIAAEYSVPYAAVFGPLPDLSGLPSRARPGDAAWEGLSDSQRDAINRIAANVGKAIEAYERKLLCVDTRFDRFMLDGEPLSEREMDGARQFLGGSDCVDCHSGPNLTDDRFHNLGLDHDGNPDYGRAEGVEALLDDPFNGVGDYSDDPAFGARRLAEVELGRSVDVGAFKTPNLRGVAQRDRFGHLGHETNLANWIDDVYDRPGGGRGGRGRGGNGGGNGNDFVGQLSPDFPDGGGNEDEMAAFLRTLNCPPLDPALLKAPDPAALPGVR